LKTLLFTLAHYENSEDVRRFLAHIRTLAVPDGWTIDVAVTDNSGGAPPESHPFTAPRNLGYLGGCAFALERYGRIPEWVAIVNPDLEFAPDALVHLLPRQLDDDVAIVAPSILLGGTTPQNPFFTRRPPRWRMAAYRVVFRSRILTRLLDMLSLMKRRRAVMDDVPRDIYAAHGSAMFLRRRFFERGATLAFDGFMFGEEIHLAEQARLRGLRVRYLPSVVAVHRGGTSTGRVTSEQRRRWHRDSADVLWRDYFRRG
jgi:GT2 family glycosyltransferase